MPYYSAPDTAEDRLFVITETLKFQTAELAAARPAPVTAETITGITAFLPSYQPLVKTLAEKLGARSREVEESTAAKAALDLVVRDYLEVLRRRTRRRSHHVAVLINHGLSESGDNPALDSWADLKAAAEALIDGDALSTAAYGAMANPSAAEVKAALEAAQDEHEDVAPADSAVQTVQKALAALADKADYWIKEIRLDALNTVRREDEPSQRRYLRKLGFTFKPFPGEAPEPEIPTDPTPIVPPTPTPPTV